MRILFILKKNNCYGFSTYTKKSSGLFNSVHFVVEELNKKGFDASLVEVVDNNDIDREVTRFKPDIVIIEALWVVPEKFKVLKKLHPRVKWFVHLHSHIPFLALEGIAIKWLEQYVHEKVGIIANSQEAFEALDIVLSHKGHNKHLFYLPNVYVRKQKDVVQEKDVPYINVACFGAIRPMKNHLMQAIAAIEFARQRDKALHFQINFSRVETGGAPVLANLRELFRKTNGTTLIELPWMEPHDLIHYLHKHVDVGMQVSLSETFNVVTADYVTAGLPVVVSDEVPWVSRFSTAKADSVESIVNKLHFAYDHRTLVSLNQFLLRNYAKRALKLWIHFLKDLS